MTEESRQTSAGRRLVRRLLRSAWKWLVAALVVSFIVYRLRFTPTPVEQHTLGLGSVVAEVIGTGTLEARISATISPRISGLITQVLADQGDEVDKGQLLATLHDGDLRQQVEVAKADLAATRAGVDRAIADVGSAEASAIQARAAHGREVQLEEKKYASTESLDKTTQQRDVAEAQLKKARAAKVEVERQVIKGEETLRYYEERLADTTIVSPFQGLVIRRSRDPGDIVVPGSEILQIISTDEMWISAWVDETAMGSVAVGQRARIVFRSRPDQPCSGTVARLAPLADRETREFQVDVTVDELPQTWAVGQRAEVYIQTATKEDALLVPTRAILWQKGRAGVFVNQAGRAQWRNVTLGLHGTDMVEITEGVKAEDTVINLQDPKSKPLVNGRMVAYAGAP